MMIRFAFAFLVCIASFAPTMARAEEEVLCPDVEVTKKATPGDIGGVQADIERLNLCVERAKLLKQLDEVVKQRQKVLKDVTQPDDMPLGALSSGVGGIPPLPVGALPPLQKASDAPPQNLKPGEVRITNAVGTAFDQAASVAPSWQIRKIWGQGAGMKAQLTDSGSGTLLNVLKGDPLPDGAVVETVSVKGVAISRNGKITDLSWEQAASSSSSAAPSNAQVVP